SFDGTTANWAAGLVTYEGRSDDGVIVQESEVSAANPTPRVRQCPEDGATNDPHCSDWTDIQPAEGSLKPFIYTKVGGPIPRGAGGADPDSATIASYFTSVGDPGGAIGYTVDGNDLIVAVAGRNTVTFVNAVAPPSTADPPATGP